MVDMTKKTEAPKVEELKVEAEEKKYNVTFTQHELDVIKKALAKSKDFQAFASVAEGSEENRILVDLESI